jgi:hypothetical protein
MFFDPPRNQNNNDIPTCVHNNRTLYININKITRIYR